MTQSKIEQVARALCGPSFDADSFLRTPDGSEPDDHRDYWLTKARAAIEAMREPTDAMVDIMSDVAIDGPGYVSFYPSMADCGALWTAGVNAALLEQQP